MTIGNIPSANEGVSLSQPSIGCMRMLSVLTGSHGLQVLNAFPQSDSRAPSPAKPLYLLQGQVPTRLITLPKTLLHMATSTTPEIPC